MSDTTFLSALRYIVTGVLWIGVLLFAAVMAGAISEGHTELIALDITAFICAAVATGFLLNPASAGGGKAAGNPAKRKNVERSLDAASLLTDDDIAELRQMVKDNFRRRLLDGGEEMTSFEALLSDREQRKRR